MCNPACLEFATSVLTREMVQGQDVLEVGALDVNGSVRSIVDGLRPSSYLGVDIVGGPGVDEICRVEEVVDRYGEGAFGLVVATELVEHVEDWRRAFDSLKRVVRPGGIILLTTRSRGFPIHGYPYDFWRYEKADIREIFADFDVRELESDCTEPGVFVVAQKPESGWQPQGLSEVELYSVVAGRRVRDISSLQVGLFVARYRAVRIARRLRRAVARLVISRAPS